MQHSIDFSVFLIALQDYLLMSWTKRVRLFYLQCFQRTKNHPTAA